LVVVRLGLALDPVGGDHEAFLHDLLVALNVATPGLLAIGTAAVSSKRDKWPRDHMGDTEYSIKNFCGICGDLRSLWRK
jgi:hypothetical protein